MALLVLSIGFLQNLMDLLADVLNLLIPNDDLMPRDDQIFGYGNC